MVLNSIENHSEHFTFDHRWSGLFFALANWSFNSHESYRQIALTSLDIHICWKSKYLRQLLWVRFARAIRMIGAKTYLKKTWQQIPRIKTHSKDTLKIVLWIWNDCNKSRTSMHIGIYSWSYYTFPCVIIAITSGLLHQKFVFLIM